MSPKTASAAKALAPAGQARIFAALGDTTRLRLVHKLGKGEPLAIATLTEGAKITRQAITKHLRVLEGAGLIRAVKEGREQHWQLKPEKLSEALEALEQISAQWDAALSRFKAMVEK
jgi:DNA-binding transcriptional ArsR family regulator